MYLTVQIMLQIHPRRHLRKCKQHSFRSEMPRTDWLIAVTFRLGAGLFCSVASLFLLCQTYIVVFLFIINVFLTGIILQLKKLTYKNQFLLIKYTKSWEKYLKRFIMFQFFLKTLLCYTKVIFCKTNNGGITQARRLAGKLFVCKYYNFDSTETPCSVMTTGYYN